jgi:hypothetical protein
MSNTSKRVREGVCTLILPVPQISKLAEVKARTGVSLNTIAALALDEYFQRHYPNMHQEGQNNAASSEDAKGEHQEQAV